ncbi:AraC family transcriptional regulator [Metabacillus rhizolycopersici]|uniref:AraC family transcriptional regulator n=1 Tax=Metabacillus rhizolycopersici TaxID=2875709 RepID=A0ABS7V064_9BACI|nr:AraC family transcriptional regulator [Metabacillus rhizolycopersici]MBZ5753550.1 AraC family transcriptional regulator [Metabacillus rhizolycopersici]
MGSRLYSFIPIQPELEQNSDYYIEKKEIDLINKTTILFYQFQLHKDLTNPISIVPDGCIDILFLCHDKTPCATVHGSRLQKKSITFQAGYEYFGFRFIPNQDTRKFNYSMKEIIDGDILLADLFTLDHHAVERMINEKKFYERINLFKELIGNNLFTDCSSQRIISYAVNKIYSSKGNININNLATELGYSSRYLRKQFEDRVGLSPKLFSQITRYQYSLHMLLNNNSVWDVIKENGYYDQAHLINEFKKFGNITPNQLVRTLEKI